MRWKTTTRYPLEIQFEDIDGGGVVHHPNYLKYLERARCQALRDLGVPFEACLKDGIAFVIAEFHAKYLSPLILGSKIIVETRLVAVRKSSLKVLQKIVSDQRPHEQSETSDAEFVRPDKQTYFVAQLRLVTVDLKTGRPMQLPENVRLAGGVPPVDELHLEPVWTDVRLSPFAER
jgi:acyl-CoA thioester hydrolase